jgi:hypothetical protein
VFLLAAQPAKEGALENPDTQPIGLRSPLLPGDRNARWMNDIGLDASAAQLTRQPEAVAAGFDGDDHAFDPVAGLDGFIPPAVQQCEQAFLIGGQRRADHSL